MGRDSGSEPALGTVVHDRLIKPGVVLVGTTRRDGSARISGVEPLVMDGELWLSMMRTSAKVADLDRDARILLQPRPAAAGPPPAQPGVARDRRGPRARRGRALGQTAAGGTVS